jgi:hypothetical protein
MANRDTEFDRAGLKHSPPRAMRIRGFLGRIDLHLVLEAEDGAVSVYYQRGREQAAIVEPFGPKYD